MGNPKGPDYMAGLNEAGELIANLLNNTPAFDSTVTALETKLGRIPTYEELKSRLIERLKQKTKAPGDDADLTARGLENDDTLLLERYKERFGNVEADPEANRKKVEDFYNGGRFQELYRIAQEKKGLGVRVLPADIAELLKNGTPEDKALHELLNGEFRELSITLWHRSDIKARLEEASKTKEKTDILNFFQDLSDIPPADQTDAKKLIMAFGRKHPQYKGKENEPWYLDQFSAQLSQLKAQEIPKLQAFYNSDTFKKLYNQVSAEIGQAPLWDDIKKALQSSGHTDMIAFATKYETESKAAWESVWKQAKAEFEAFEKQAFDAFIDNLSPADYADLDALAERFQKTRKRFAGAKRLDWYKRQLQTKMPILEMQWENQVDDFFRQDLPALYDRASQQVAGYPKWTDISAQITDPDLKYLLESKYRPQAEAKWQSFWQERQQKFNETGEKNLTAFLESLEVTQLDSLEAAKRAFEAAHPDQKADNSWFESAYETAKEKALDRFNERHQSLVSTLSDSALAKAMQQAFLQASSFAEREKWLAENQRKVAEYQTLIDQNQRFEADLSARLNEYPDLKAQLSTLLKDYQAGRTQYQAGFFSPRKLNEGLQALSDQLRERERLVVGTINHIENKTFNQIPPLTDKKKLNYEEFRDALKKLNFYELDPLVQKHPEVRATARKRTKALHEQWLDHRRLYLEKNKEKQVSDAQKVIGRVKLPAGMPEDLKDYKAFTFALKDKAVYAALPPQLLKNEAVRASAHDQNLKMWQQYQAQEAKRQVAAETELKATETIPEVDKAKAQIAQTKLTPELSDRLKIALKDKDPGNPDQFASALTKIGVYSSVAPELWSDPSLREAAWQQNLKLRSQFLSGPKGLIDLDDSDPESSDRENNFGLPGHYHINWEKLDNSVSENQRTLALERFKQMHNQSNTGLQTVMQGFHQPLGTFILQTLAVMPKDRFDKAVTALRSVPVEVGKRRDASQWLKVLCENAGMDFLAKENSAAWSELKQNFSTHFGTTLEKAWENVPETEEAENLKTETETAETLSALEITNTDTAEAEDTTSSGTQTSDDEEAELTEADPDLLATEEEFEADETFGKEFEAVDLEVEEDETRFNAETEETEDPLEEATLDDAALETEADDIETAVSEDEASEEGSTELPGEIIDLDTEARDDEPLDDTDARVEDQPNVDFHEGDLSVSDDTIDRVETDETELVESDVSELALDEPESLEDEVADSEVETPELPEGENEAEGEGVELADADTLEADVDDSMADEDAETADEKLLESIAAEFEEPLLETEVAEDLENTESTEVTETTTLAELETNNTELTAELEDEVDHIESQETVSQAETVDLNRSESEAAVTDQKSLKVGDAEAPEIADLQDTAAETVAPEIADKTLNEDTQIQEAEADVPVLERINAETESKEASTEKTDPQRAKSLDQNTEAEVENQDVETVPVPTVVETIIPERLEVETNETEVKTALQSWQRFTETNLPLLRAQEATDLKKQFSEILKSGFDENTIAKLKASGTWERLMASPAHQQLLRTHLKQHQALSNEGLHFYTTLQQEMFFSRSLTVSKFLEQIKSYVYFTRELNALIQTTRPEQDLSAGQARSLFNAFAHRYHQAKSINRMELRFENDRFVVNLKTPQGAQRWQFGESEALAA